MSATDHRTPGLLPILDWIRRYPASWLRNDVVAGLTAAAVVIPKGIASAAIAGLPLSVGLYTCVTPAFLYAVLGTSSTLSVTTTAPLAILTAAELLEGGVAADPAAAAAAAAALSILVGGMLAVAAVLRFGFLANFISEPVLTGFKSGVGFVIVIDQVPKLLGIHFDKGRVGENVLAILRHLSETSLPTLALAGGVFATIVLIQRLAPRLPGPLLALVLATVASHLFNLDRLGVEVVGPVASGLPPLTLPSTALLLEMWPAAAGIALMSFTESVAAGRAFLPPGSMRPVANRELLATGAANLAGGLFGAMPAGGGTTQTAVNFSAGARSQIAALVTAVISLATLVVLAPLIAAMPHAALAAVVVTYAAGLIRPDEFRRIRDVRRTEFRWALVALAGVIVLGTLRGILVAVIVSMFALMQQANNPPVYRLGRKRGTDVFRPPSDEHPDDETFPGMLLVRIEGRVYFGNAQRIGEKLLPLVEEARPRVVVIDCSAMFDLEYTALKMLTEADERMERDGIALWLTALTPEVRRVIERSPLGQRLGHDRMLFNLQAAIARYQEQAKRDPQG
jgi:high affinity sulfate transporter 1